MNRTEKKQEEREEGKTINTFNIEKGSIVFAVTAANSVQIITGNHFTIAVCKQEEMTSVSNLSKEELKLHRYIPDMQSLQDFITEIQQCDTAYEVAVSAWRRLDNVYITKENIVTAEFIESLQPFIKQIKSGTSTDNLRCHINKLMMEKKA